MLTGQRLFTGETVSHVLGAVLQLEPKWDALPVPTPQPLRKLLQRCLEKDRKRRLRDIGDALTELDEPSKAEPIDETAVTPVAQQARWRETLPLAVAASVVVGLTTGFAVWSLARPEVVEADVMRFSIVPPEALPLSSSLHRDLVISPDGTQILYVSGGNTGQINLRAIPPVPIICETTSLVRLV